MFRPSTLLIAAVIALPLPAFAAEDCAARISAMESHPAFAQQPKDEAEGAEGDITSESDSSEHAEKGVAVEENGGTTVYQEGGPALPRESWFTGEEDKAVALGHLSAAKEAEEAGDAATCAEEMDQAEKILAAASEEEREEKEQAD
ncbi:MAG: hypothetical protein WD489_08555 [Rhodovibrionaceae bacterium]